MLVDGAQDIEQASLASSRVAQDDHELSLLNIHRHSSEGSHSFESEEVGLMEVVPRDDAGLVLELFVVLLCHRIL